VLVTEHITLKTKHLKLVSLKAPYLHVYLVFCPTGHNHALTDYKVFTQSASSLELSPELIFPTSLFPLIEVSVSQASSLAYLNISHLLLINLTFTLVILCLSPWAGLFPILSTPVI
jgi:hypothetical protein